MFDFTEVFLQSGGLKRPESLDLFCLKDLLRSEDD